MYFSIIISIFGSLSILGAVSVKDVSARDKPQIKSYVINPVANVTTNNDCISKILPKVRIMRVGEEISCILGRTKEDFQYCECRVSRNESIIENTVNYYFSVNTLVDVSTKNRINNIQRGPSYQCEMSLNSNSLDNLRLGRVWVCMEKKNSGKVVRFDNSYYCSCHPVFRISKIVVVVIQKNR